MSEYEYLSKNIISTVDQNILDTIHQSNTFQNKLKKSLLKFELGQNTNIDDNYAFNIWCKPVLDGAGDFILIKKIAKELVTYGISHNKINFIIGTHNLIGFLRILNIFYHDIEKTLQSYNRTINNNLTPEQISVNNLIVSLEQLQSKINEINTTLDVIHIKIDNFSDSDKRVKTLMQNIADNFAIDEGIFDKQKNYDFFSRVKKTLEESVETTRETQISKLQNNSQLSDFERASQIAFIREGKYTSGLEKLSSLNTYIEHEVTNDKFGILIKFIFQNILKEFPGANIYIFDANNYKYITDNTDNNTYNYDEQTVRVDMSPNAEFLRNHYYMQIARNCRFDGQNVQTINLQLLTSIPTQNQLSNSLSNESIFSNCDLNKIFYLNEGGNIISRHQNCLGIGKDSLGIFKAITDSTRDGILEFLNNVTNKYRTAFEPNIDKYHIVYVGQVMMYEIKKPRTEYDSEQGLRIFTIQRVFLFLKLLQHKYRDTRDTTIHVFILNVFKTILDLHYDTSFNGVFPEYNHEEKTFRVNETTKLQLKFFSRIAPEFYLGFVKHSEPILYTTGDQSYQEALSFGKLVFHDYYDHRINMVNNLLDCYNIFIGQRYNNYKLFCTRYLNLDNVFTFNFEQHIRRFFSNRTIIDALNNCLNDYFNEENPQNRSFHEFYMKYYDFSKEFKKIIFLMQNNALNFAVDDNILISPEINQYFDRIDDASYKKKYLKYKQKYAILKNKLTNKNVDINKIYYELDNNITYKQKYLKYKQKYSELKGGAITFEPEGTQFRLNRLLDERSKHSPIFTSFQKNITENLFEYLNKNIKFRLNINHNGSKILLGNYIIKDLSSGSVIGRGANGIAIQFDNNIVIKVVKFMATNPDIIENEVENMIELYRQNGEYNFRNDNLIKLLGVVYINNERRLIQNFDQSRTYVSQQFTYSLDDSNENDKIGFVIMEKYAGDLTTLRLNNLGLGLRDGDLLKYDIAKQMIVQLNEFFKKGYYHTDLHEGNWFYKREGEKYIVTIADYGSEIKAGGNKIGVHKLSETPESQNNEKTSSLKMLLTALGNCSIITFDELFSVVSEDDYQVLLDKLINILNQKYQRYPDDDDFLEISGILLSLKTR